MRRFKRGRPLENPIERFLREFEIINGCWIWTGPVNQEGYPIFFDGVRNQKAHRFSYGFFTGPVTPGNTIKQTCHNRLCINPDHLKGSPRAGSLGTIRAAQQRAKTHCSKGHPYDMANTYFYRNSGGNIARQCKTCMRARELVRNDKVIIS